MTQSTIKSGTRAIGIAESTDETADTCYLGAATVSPNGHIDDIEFDTATVGGTDATSAIKRILETGLRPDIQYVLISGIAPAWFNIIDLEAIATSVEVPVISVSFEASTGLEASISSHFSGTAREKRLSRYDALPRQQPVKINEKTRYIRAVDIAQPSAATVIKEFTPTGGRPEPLRVARLAARGLRRF